jgi:hypothetical protein
MSKSQPEGLTRRAFLGSSLGVVATGVGCGNADERGSEGSDSGGLRQQVPNDHLLAAGHPPRLIQLR